MDRKSRILVNALAISKEDGSILDYLKVPRYESTKGLDESERDAVISNRSLLNISSTPEPNKQIQVEQVSSTNKKHITRVKVNQLKKNLFCNLTNNDNQFAPNDSNDIDKITSNFDENGQYSETDSEQGDSSDDFIPASEESSDSNTDYDSDASYRNKKYKKNIHDIDTKGGNNDSDCKNINVNSINTDVKQTRSIIIHCDVQLRRPRIPHIKNDKRNNIALDEPDERNKNCDTKERVATATKITRKRIWNKRDYCYYCVTDVLKFSRHVQRHHAHEFEVQQILSLNVGDKRRKYLFNALRNKGNFLRSSTEENVIPVRKPVFGITEQPTTSNYLPCKYCHGFYKKNYLYRHVKACPHNATKPTGRTNPQSDGQSLLSSYRENDMLRNEVFPTMRADPVSFVAKTDPLICAVARRYLKSHREKQFRAVAARKMRQLAALLIELKKMINSKNLLSALDPINFDIIVKCTKIISKYNPEKDTYGAPSLALHFGTELKDCIDVAYNMIIRKNSQETEATNKLKMLKDLIATEWRYEISTVANSDMQQKKWNKPSLIPLAEDLTLLRKYLLLEGEKYRNKLQHDPRDERAFKTLQEITYVQLLLLNRRRVGELERMTVMSYTDNINNQCSKEFDNCISDSERALMKLFKRVVIRGKRGRGVPVLFTDEMVKNTNLLLQMRDNFVKSTNRNLFANTNSSSGISGSRAVYKHVRLAGAKNCDALTSTKLRKHLATMSQLINLSEQDLEQLANFMGHTSDIHKVYYRLPNDVYQTAKISKLLLLNEKGEASHFKGKRLDEIDLALSLVEEENTDNEDEEIDGKVAQQEAPVEKNERKEDAGNNPKKRRILVPWSENQREAALLFFKEHIKKKIAPKKHECLELQEENADLFSNKNWEKIKIFIVNTYNNK